ADVSKRTISGFDACPGVSAWLLPETIENWLLPAATVEPTAVNEIAPRPAICARTTLIPGVLPSVSTFLAWPLASATVTGAARVPLPWSTDQLTSIPGSAWPPEATCTTNGCSTLPAAAAGLFPPTTEMPAEPIAVAENVKLIFPGR